MNAYKIIDKIYDKDWIKKFNLENKAYKNIGKFATKRGLNIKIIRQLESMQKVLDEAYPNMYDFSFTFKVKTKTHTNKYYASYSYGTPSHIYNKRYITRTEWESQRGFEILNKVVISTIDIVLHYPEITIVNNKNESHTIRDLIVHIPILEEHRNEILIGKIRGTRTTLSTIEAQCGYLHSHLRAISKSNLVTKITPVDTFCTGSDGTEILFLQSDLNSEYDEDTFELYLYAIKAFLEYESLEGGPHIKMNNILSKEVNVEDIPLDSLKTCYNNFVSRIAERRKLNLDWRYIDSKYEIVDNYKLEELALSIATLSGNSAYFKDDSGEYFRIATVECSKHIGTKRDWIPFRGEKKYLVITGEQLDKTIVHRKEYCNPQIKNYVKKRLEYEINSIKANEDRARGEADSNSKEIISR